MADRKTYKPSRFDFDIGFLIKSPCRECWRKDQLPACSHACEQIDRVQTILAHSVLSTRSYSSLEAFAVHLETVRKK